MKLMKMVGELLRLRDSTWFGTLAPHILGPAQILTISLSWQDMQRPCRGALLVILAKASLQC